jgi:uncharacterized protein with PQ loop repeat
MILKIDPRKAFDKIQHPFMIKVLKKLGIEGVLINIIKATYDKLRANTILNGKQLKLPIKVKNQIGLITSSILIQYSFGFTSQSNKTRDRNKKYLSRKGRSQTIPTHR